MLGSRKGMGAMFCAFLSLLTFPARADVTQFHADAARTGKYVVPGLTYEAAANLAPVEFFKSPPIAGPVRTQPLFWTPPGGGQELIITDMLNDVYAINAISGKVIWEKNLGPIYTGASSPCPPSSGKGPGILGTAIIDANGILYLDAATQSGDFGPQHEIYALDLKNNGAVVSGWPVDPGLEVSGFVDDLANNHTAAQLVNGRVYFAYSALGEDCGNYRGWVVGINTANPTEAVGFAPSTVFDGPKNPNAIGGGIWAPAGVITDGQSLYVTTGNAKQTSGQYSGGDSVFRIGLDLSFSGSTADYWAPSNYHTLDVGDLDVGSTAPVLVPVVGDQTYIMLAGKSGVAWFLKQNMGGVGVPAAAAFEVANSDGEVHNSPPVDVTPAGTYVVINVDGGPAQGCPPNSSATAQLETLLVTPGPKIKSLWCADTGSPPVNFGIPVITNTPDGQNPMAWVLSSLPSNTSLYAYNLLTGQQIVAVPLSQPTAQNQTIIFAEGNLYISSLGSPGSEIFKLSWRSLSP